METYRNLVPVAIQIASKAHGEVVNKDGSPYILHPIRLMMRAHAEDPDSHFRQIVAVLHDTIEDTPLTLGDLESAGFPPIVVEAVDALSKRPGEEYEQFIERIGLNRLAAGVKLLDLYDNIDVTRLPELGEWELQRTAKYHRAILRLRHLLGE